MYVSWIDSNTKQYVDNTPTVNRLNMLHKSCLQESAYLFLVSSSKYPI